MDKQEIINELYRLYRLKEQGKDVDSLIAELEAKLCEACEKEIDKED